jgi:VanZ family protein
MIEINHNWNYYDYLRTVPAIIFACIIFYFSSLSNPFPEKPSEPPTIIKLNWNEILHVCEFTLFGFLIAFGFIGKVRYRYLILFAIIYAFLDEVHQYFIPTRYFDLYDIILDSIGVVIGFAFYLLLDIISNILKKKYDNWNPNKK